MYPPHRTVYDDGLDDGKEVRSLHNAWADSTTSHGRLMMTVLGGLAEFERELITARTSEGRKRAKDSGIKFGPKFKLNKFQRAVAMQRKNAGKPSPLSVEPTASASQQSHDRTANV